MCDNEEKCNLGNLSEYDVKINKLRTMDMYNGTYLVCVIYGLFALAILLGSYFNDTIRDIFFNQFIIFTIIFIIGSSIIISMLFYYLYNYKPKKTKQENIYDTYSCPDYWNMVMLDDNSVYNKFDSNISPNYFKYKCVLNPNIFDKYDNYDNADVNYKQNNYNLTNNLLNTTNLDASTNGDYFNETNKDKIKNNITTNNLGHLYKNINDTGIFPVDNTKNYFVYNQPGTKLNNTDIEKIKTTIIDSSLKMNNYQKSSTSNVYSNINVNPYTENIDPAILWNFNNENQTNVNTKYTNASQYKFDGTNFYENFYVYKWTYDSINFNHYKNIFPIVDYVNPNNPNYNRYISRKVFAAVNNTPPLIVHIGKIEKDIEKDKIYFVSKENKNGNSSRLLFNNITADSNNNKIIDSYIDKNDTYKDRPDPTTYAQVTGLERGPKIIVDNGYGRPPVITEADIKTNPKNIPVVCDTVYPAYLASIEDINAYGSDNAIRCSYAKLCGYSWSDMGCN